MLLFSTVLDLNDFVSPDDFIRLVIEWNDSSTHTENIVPDIRWQGERTVRYGDDKLWLEFAEYPEKHVLAARHVKITKDGVTWASDFVVNFSEKRISIQLDRTYDEDALVMGAAFSTPHFITLLIENGFLRDDNNLPVLRTPVYVTDDDLEKYRKVLTGSKTYKLPVVYVSKTSENENPLSVEWLSSRLKGAAHVLVEASAGQCMGIRKLLGKAEEQFGAVRVFYPSETVSRKKYYFRSASGNANDRLEKVIRNVIQYGISQRVERLLTWQGVSAELLNVQLEKQIVIRMNAENARRKAEDEVDKVYETFDEEFRDLQNRVAELTKANEALQYENQGLRAKYATSDASPILYFGDEEEFYHGEIRDMVLGTLDDALVATEKATRKADVLADILENNTYYHLSEERKKRIKDLFKGYKNLTGAMRQELQSLGFEITEAGKHYKVTYGGDQRYMVTVGKTPSDNRSGSNSAALISKVML